MGNIKLDIKHSDSITKEKSSKIVSKVPRKDVSDSTVKKLFAKSGNQCAMPSCIVPLVYEDTDSVKGIICHIEAASKKGPRYNPKQTEKERYSFQNLIILCPNCHKDIDTNPYKYTVKALIKYKKDHESKNMTNPYSLPDHLLKIYKLSINDDSFAPDLLEFYLELYHATNDKELKTKIYDRVRTCINNLNLESIKDKSTLQAYSTKILKLCHNLDDEIFIRCFFLLMDTVKLDLITTPIKDRFKSFLDNNYESSEIPRLYWIVYQPTTASIDNLIKDSGRYNQSLFADISKELPLDKINFEDKLRIDRDLWRLLDENKNHEDNEFKNLSELERIIFNSFSIKI